MTDDDEIWFVLTFGALFLGLGLVSFFGHVCLYFFKMQRILDLLGRSSGVWVSKSFSFFGAYLVLICIGSFMLFPSLAIRGGALDKDDYLNFPRELMMVVRICYLSALGGGGAMIVLLAGCKYMGWIE